MRGKNRKHLSLQSLSKSCWQKWPMFYFMPVIMTACRQLVSVVIPWIKSCSFTTSTLKSHCHWLTSHSNHDKRVKSILTYTSNKSTVTSVALFMTWRWCRRAFGCRMFAFESFGVWMSSWLVDPMSSPRVVLMYSSSFSRRPSSVDDKMMETRKEKNVNVFLVTKS